MSHGALLSAFGKSCEGMDGLSTMRERLLDTAAAVALFMVLLLPFALVAWLVSALL